MLVYSRLRSSFLIAHVQLTLGALRLLHALLLLLITQLILWLKLVELIVHLAGWLSLHTVTLTKQRLSLLIAIATLSLRVASLKHIRPERLCLLVLVDALISVERKRRLIHY